MSLLDRPTVPRRRRLSWRSVTLVLTALTVTVGATAAHAAPDTAPPPDTVPVETVPPQTVPPETTGPAATDGTVADPDVADETTPGETVPAPADSEDTGSEDTGSEDTGSDPTDPDASDVADPDGPDEAVPGERAGAEVTVDDVPPGLPSEPPPGFSEEQYRRFVEMVSACGVSAGRVCEQILAWTGNQSLAEAGQWIVDVPLRLVAIAAVAFGAHWLVRRAVDRSVRRLRARTAGRLDGDSAPTGRNEVRLTLAADTIGRAATVVIVVIAALVGLGEIGVSLGPLLAGAGIAGIALGFGAQHLVRDVLAGLFVVLEDHYGVGDVVATERATGTVEEITLRVTKLRDVHGTLWIVPNGTIDGVGNMTQLWARAIIDFDVDLRADHERAGVIIKETADRLWHQRRPGFRILEEPELWGVESISDSAVVIRVAVKSAPAEQWAIARELRSEVKKALNAADIMIPVPQQTIWVHAAPSGASADQVAL